MTTFDQGDVVLVAFPFTDLTSTKQRPAMVMSARWFNEKPEHDCVLVAITSVIPSRLARDEIRIADGDLKNAGLVKPSIVRVGKLFTLNQTLIQKRLGKLPPGALQPVLHTLAEIIPQPPSSQSTV